MTASACSPDGLVLIIDAPAAEMRSGKLLQCDLFMNSQDKILLIIRKIAKTDVSPAPGESLFDSGILDSFALPDMVGELEQEFGIQVPDADLNPRKFDSIERIEQYIASRT